MKMPPRLLAAVVLLIPLVAGAQSICPCVPVSHFWTVSSCDTWDCAASAFILGSGSPDVMVMPTSADAQWLVLRRVASGTEVVADSSFTLDSFEGIGDAMTRYNGIDATLRPIMLSAPDGKILVVARRPPDTRRRPTGR